MKFIGYNLTLHSNRMEKVQILFPMEPAAFWQKLKAIVEQVVIEHQHKPPLQEAYKIAGQKPLLKVTDVCRLFSISKPTLYEWMHQGKLPSVKIRSRRFFRTEDVEQLIEASKITDSTP